MVNKHFIVLKKSLVALHVLGYPDPKLPFILDADANRDGVGGDLSQVMEIVEGKLMGQLKINSRLHWCAVCPKPIRRIII